jgi:glucokinase
VQTLGIDLGGTFARAAVVDADGKILSATKTALRDRSPPAVVESSAQAAQQAVQAAGAPVSRCGVGAAGQLHGDSGLILVAPNLGWRNVPFGSLLQARLGHAVRVVNDLSAAAWGEFRAGAGQGVRDLLVVFVGSGVGSAIIANGQLVSGANGVAAEFGHVKVLPKGRGCGCGEAGCLEAYAGGHNLIAQMKEAVAEGRAPKLLELAGGDANSLNPVHLELAAQAGEAAAREIYDRAADALALAIANQITVLNPAKLILGGGVLAHCPGMRQRILDGIASYASGASRSWLQVVEAALGDDSGLIGAALLARAAARDGA